MACNKDLLANGQAYPRICEDCGALSPCRKYSGTSLYDLTPLHKEALSCVSRGAVDRIVEELRNAIADVEAGRVRSAVSCILRAAGRIETLSPNG